MSAEITSLNDFFGNLNAHIVEKHLKGVTAVYQFKISGDGGGNWIVDVKDNTVTVKNTDALLKEIESMNTQLETAQLMVRNLERELAQRAQEDDERLAETHELLTGEVL